MKARARAHMRVINEGPIDRLERERRNATYQKISTGQTGAYLGECRFIRIFCSPPRPKVQKKHQTTFPDKNEGYNYLVLVKSTGGTSLHRVSLISEYHFIHLRDPEIPGGTELIAFSIARALAPPHFHKING